MLELLATFGNGAQQGVQRFIALQGTQILGVRTGDVDGDVVGLRVDAVQASQVIIHRVFDRRDSVFADVQAQQQRQLATGLLAKRGRPHMAQKGVQPFLVKTQPVDQRVGLRQPEHARFGVARLRLGRDGAYLNKAKTHGGQAVYAARVLVQPGGHAYTVRKS